MMEEIVILLIVGLAGWYLVRRYLRNRKAGGVCDCSDGSCDIKNPCSACSAEEIALKGRPGTKNGEKGASPMKKKDLNG